MLEHKNITNTLMQRKSPNKQHMFLTKEYTINLAKRPETIVLTETTSNNNQNNGHF